MEWLISFFRWFSGGERQYHNLFHCLKGDHLWIAITVALDLAVATGYMFIAGHWARNQRRLRNERARAALARMRNIFVFCGICGYIFIPIKMVWPAWRLYDCFMVVLVYFTWRYALDARDLEVVYNELNLSEERAADLRASREESRRKTHFLNSVSHDLRTPLNGMVLQVDFACDSLEHGDRDTALAALQNARSGAQATARLLDSFMELAQLDFNQDQPRPERFDLRDLIDSTLDCFRLPAQGKGIDLVVSGQNPPVETDRAMLKRILLNLFSNAVKFTNAGQVRVEVSTDGPKLRIDVIDTGIGIGPEHRDRLFDEFYQVHNAERDRTKGFGLGLPIARRLARKLGGDVTYETTDGPGSRFTVVLERAVLLDRRDPPTKGDAEHGLDIESPSRVGH